MSTYFYFNLYQDFWDYHEFSVFEHVFKEYFYENRIKRWFVPCISVILTERKTHISTKTDIWIDLKSTMTSNIWLNEIMSKSKGIFEYENEWKTYSDLVASTIQPWCLGLRKGLANFWYWVCPSASWVCSSQPQWRLTWQEPHDWSHTHSDTVPV